MVPCLYILLFYSSLILSRREVGLEWRISEITWLGHEKAHGGGSKGATQSRGCHQGATPRENQEGGSW